MYDDSYPSRPSSHRRQYSRRTMAAAYNNSMPCTPTSEKCIATPTQPQNHQEVIPEVLSEPQVFEFLYGIIFSMIHTALMTILAPVLGDDKKKRRRESSKISPKSSQVDVSPEVIEEGVYGIPQQQQHQQLPPVVDNSDCISVASHSSQHSSRSHTHRHPTILRRGSDPSENKKIKSVRFPSRNVRAQPPLGRIGYTTSSLSSSSSKNSGSSLSSSDSSSGNSRERSSRPAAVAPVAMSTRRPRRSSPLRTMVTQRMAQTSYFLE